MDARLENYNLARDARSCDAAKPPVLHMDDGSEIELPMIWEVCSVCDGKGTHVNPAIDAGGLNTCDMDMDELADYFGGIYDQPCNSCRGRTTVPAVHWKQLTTEQREQYEAQLQADDDYRAEQLAEIRAGC